MLIARFAGGDNPRGEHFPSFFLTFLSGKKLAIHLIAGDVVRVAFDERPKVLVGCGGIAVLYAFQSESVARESIAGFLRDEFFKKLTAGFLLSKRLFGHRNVPYYTGARESSQTLWGAWMHEAYEEKQSS